MGKIMINIPCIVCGDKKEVDLELYDGSVYLCDKCREAILFIRDKVKVASEGSNFW